MKSSKNNYIVLIVLFLTVQCAFAQTDDLRYAIDDISQPDSENLSNLDFSNSLSRDIQYNPETGEYEIVTKIGDVVINTDTLTSEEYDKYSTENNMQEYWKQRLNYEINQSRAIQEPNLTQYLDTTNIPFLDVSPSGGFDLITGIRTQNVKNPTLPIRQRKTTGLDFDMNIRMNVTGSIADRLKFDANYNTESNFNFNKNQFKVGYEGKEDDILQSVEFGNVQLPLKSSLIQGSQSLLGVKTSFQFGRLTATAVMSQQESQQQGIVLEGGSQKQDFEIKADDYEDNKHFFISHYFRDQYERNMNTLPALNTPYNITRLQVWVTNRSFQTTNIREFVAFTDLGEPNVINNPSVQPTGGTNYADNSSNSLYSTVTAGTQIRQIQTVSTFLGSNGYQEAEDYELITARKLEENEYEFNRDLGYISIDRSLAPDEVLAVAFEYTDLQGNVRRVGEFSESLGLSTTSPTSQDQILVLKLLKPRAPRTDLPTWDLMMKNIYPLGAFQIDQSEFRLDIYYNDPGEGLKRYLPLPEDEPRFEDPLIQVFNLDRFNASTIAIPDGVFDFLPGYTIDARTGRLIFPVLEPFGDHIRNVVTDATVADAIAFDELYNLTKTQAVLFPEFNRFSITGSYRSEVRDEISLGAFNIPRGSVTVHAGGRQLLEGSDYTIDYNLGRVKILNTALINSGSPLDVRFENNLQFGFQSKRLAGTRLDYYVNEKFNIGATAMNLRERPFTNKVNLGDDPISNSVLGLDLRYESKSPWLTRVVDKIPFIDTKEESSINLQAEYARFIPGHSKQIGKGEAGQVYIDDFEGSSSSYDLKFPPESWTISSTPQRFPESDLINNIENNFNRALISWYNIDPILNSDNTNNGRPENIDREEQSDVYGRQVLENEVFPNIVNQQRITVPLTTFDVSYYPTQRGPYNFDTEDLTPNGNLRDPRDKWGGIMRDINVTDFQAANVEFVEFWLMDPFLNTDARPNNSQNSGKLILNLGNISEDILRDGRMFFENGLPEPGQQSNLDETNLGRVPTVLNINSAFAAGVDGLLAQDIGYDGLNNDDEFIFFSDYINRVQQQFGTGSQAYQNAINDPSGDDFHNFLGDDYDQEQLGIVERYKKFTNPQGNSSGSVLDQGQFAYNATNTPDTEDVNRDNTLERTEAYYEYEIDLSSSDLQVGQNFIVSETTTNAELPNGTTREVKWYQFKVPISGYTSTVNNIQGFQSIRFMRMYLTEFPQETTLRFARLNLLRNQWRRYEFEVNQQPPTPVNDNIAFNVFPINIEEDQNKSPFPYVLPPGLQREEIQGAANSFLRNEQSLAMNVCALPDGNSRAIYKLLDLDLRQFEKLQMYVHIEQLLNEVSPIDDGDFELFVRVGSDFSQNFYEYKLPLKVSQLGGLDAFNIWPEENNVEVNMQDWIDLKKERNLSSTSPFDRYSNADGSLTVLGTPDLGRASNVMIGVTNVVDDKLDKCAEVWINELRVSGINEEAGYAALARADIKLADFGDISVSGNLHSAGYGSIEQRVDERFRDDLTEFDVSGTFNLDKFLPAKSTFKLPVYASYSKLKSKPQYNPYETDLLLEDSSEEVRQALEDDVEIKTVSLTNVRKERNPDREKSPKIYDLENLNFSYSYTEKNTNTAIIADEVDKTHYGALAYNFSPEPKPIRPFFNLVKEQKYLQWLKEFNFNPIPSTLGFRTDMTNRYQETALRDIQEPTIALEDFYYKDWIWNRNYDLQWDLTNSINVGFNASNQSRIDQPEGAIDSDIKRDSVWTNVKNFGRNVIYNHSANASYKLPLKFIPILDWMNAEVNYNTDYNWLSAPQQLNLNGQVELNTLGNAIRNTQDVQLNTTLDLNGLYNKSNFLKKYTGDTASRTRPQPTRTRPGAEEEPKEEEAEEEKKPFDALSIIMKPLLSVKRVTLNYTDQRGTFVPGFTPTPTNFGQDLSQNAPGWGFVFGEQVSTEWLDEAARKDWITKDTTFSYQYLQDRTRQFSGRASLQPVKNFNLDISLDYSKTDNYSELFRNDGTIQNPDFQHFNGYESGAYDISFISFKTLFQKRDPDDVPEVFKDFQDKRIEASQLLANQNPNSVGEHPDDPNYREGYGPYSQEVIMPAFIAAYTGKSVNDVKLDPFKTSPLPNWSLNYSGLTDIPFVGKTFSTFRISHTYSSSFSVNQYNSNLKFEGPDDYFLPTAIDTLSNNFYAFYYIPQVIITESFSPLAGIDFVLQNGLRMNMSYLKTRTLGMSLLDYQLSENNRTGYTIGAGYQAANLKLPFRLFGKSRVLENDVIFNFNYSFDDAIVTNYKLDQETALPTRGSKTVSINPTIDYTINERINLQLYLERRTSEPKTRSSYPVNNTRSGMKLSYTFGR